ncbi:hypothetical protein [Bdellovibrio bacteriovorus]|uniref:hypothetical protein n=1 Tax=Bdellovibrio bacteriovorus TaxID=959 RepID=UPI0035A6E15D
MGFKNLLSKADFAKTFTSYFNTATTILQKSHTNTKVLYPEDTYKYLFASDSILIGIETSHQGGNSNRILNYIEEDYFRLFHLVYVVNELQASLAKDHNLWIRGAISAGKACIIPEKSIYVGQPIVDSHELEKMANFPRVIIDPKIFAHFSHSYGEFSRNLGEIAPHERILFDMTSPKTTSKKAFEDGIPTLNWFDFLLTSEMDVEPFFEDLKERMNSSMDLYKKGQLLLSMITESFERYCDSFILSPNPNERTNRQPYIDKIERLIRSCN